MGHITRNTAFFNIDIDSSSKVIVISQNWKYEWLPNAMQWSYFDREKMHKEFEKVIFESWSNRARVQVSGTSEYARLYKNDYFTINFDIKWVTHSPYHFKVEVNKISPNDFTHIPSVSWNRHLIQLYTVDNKPLLKVGAPKGVRQKNVAHEFGHAIGNNSGIRGMHADEYKHTSRFYKDKSSIMNVGMEIRTRHFDYLIQELNTMIPNTIFSIKL